MVRTEYRIHDKSTYLRLNERTFQVAYQYVLISIKYILFAYSCTTFLQFLTGTYVYILILAEYILLVPESSACMQGPAGLLASNSGTRPLIATYHTSTGSFIHCCLAAPSSVPGRLGAAGAGSLLGSASPDLQPP